ncbi:MAG: aldo/keto reductase [Bacilli bacterium]|nr:aldo/keto reductase [Bacilli bacterium]
MLDIKDLHPIGIGTWTISKETYDKDIKGLLYSFEKGQNSIECNASYLAGESLDVVADFIKQIDREKIFINAVMTYGVKNADDVHKFLDLYLKKLGTTYVDCITYGATLDFLEKEGFETSEYLKVVRELQKQGKTRYIGMSNLSPEDYIKYGPFDHFEGCYGLETKVYEDNGLLEIAKQSFVAYQPLRRNRTAKMNYPILVELAEKYGKTQNQIILNWITKHKGIKILCKCTDIPHIEENLQSLNFDMQESDYIRLDEFRQPFFDNLKVKYREQDEGILIHQVPNQDPLGKEKYIASYGTDKETMKIKE